MAIQNEPTRISTPFADAGTKNVIPETMAQPSATAAASWQAGFPTVCSLPLSAGGIPPARNDFNGLFNQITQTERFLQDGGIFAWDASTDYGANRLVLGSDGKLYWSVAQSGPNTGAGAVDPTTDSGAYWGQLPVTATEAAEASYASVSGGFASWSNTENYTDHQIVLGSNGLIYIVKTPSGPDTAAGAQDPTADNGTYWQLMPTDNADVVHKTGNETIGGVKTFTSEIVSKSSVYCDKASNSLPECILSNPDAQKPSNWPSSAYQLGVFGFGGQDRSLFGAVRLYLDATVSEMGFFIYKQNNTNNSVKLRHFTSGNQAPSWMPEETGALNLGEPAHLWKQLYASTATINTSDARVKTEPGSMSDDMLDAWGDIDFVQFQMLDAVAKKGADKARVHSGLIAQHISDAFAARGLDATRYGFFCWDSWDAEPERVNEDGEILEPAIPAGDRFSLRYEEALCVEAAYQRRRADRAEARIAALEERLAALEARLA